MNEYSVYETKARLSEVLRQVKQHREVIVTERGKRIARIVPYVETEEESIDERLERMQRSGLLMSATDGAADFTVAPFGKSPGALDRLLEDRAEPRDPASARPARAGGKSPPRSKPRGR